MVVCIDMEEPGPNESMKSFRRDLKRAKIFAIQHLTRRIRLLRNKRGTEQQVEKNLRKAERFLEEIEYIKDLDINIVLKKVQNQSDPLTGCITKDDMEDIEERALVRLISSKPIQNKLKDMECSKSEKKKTSNQQKTINIAHTAAERISKSKKSQRKKSSESREDASSLNETEFSSSEVTEEQITCTSHSDEETVIEEPPMSFFVESMASTTKDDLKNSPKNKQNSKKKVLAKKSSNRLGQRARQRLWQEKYGKKANHLKSTGKIRKTTKLEKGKTSKEDVKPNKGIKRNKRMEETMSHPSWEASKRRKQQHNINQTQFQGQKIIFDDND